MTILFDDGILQATLYPSQWVLMRWIQNKHGKLQKRLIKDLNNIEKIILAMKLPGWFALSELENVGFHKLLEKFGATHRDSDQTYKWFIKPIATEGDLHVR